MIPQKWLFHHLSLVFRAITVSSERVKPLGYEISPFFDTLGGSAKSDQPPKGWLKTYKQWDKPPVNWGFRWPIHGISQS